MDARDLDDLVAVWRGGSLSAAAKRRGVAVSTLSRRMEALEATLKLHLVDRQGRGTQLTEHGKQIAALAEPISDQLGRVARAADALRAGSQTLPVRVSATEIVVSDILAPQLPKLWESGARFPLHLQSEPDIISLAARDADLAVRMSRPKGASLIARRLPPLRPGFFASWSYLGGRDPAALDLRSERLLVHDDSFGRIAELDWLDRQGLGGAFILRTGSMRALFAAALSGAGIALLFAGMAAHAEGLVEIPVAAPPPARTPWLVIHRDLRRQPSIRAVHRWIVMAFEHYVGNANG